MTYCLAIQTAAGLAFASDSRTNAGVDYVSQYSKLQVFAPSDDRLFVLLSAGNLATTQEIVQWIGRDLDAPEPAISLRSVRYLFEAAAYVGRTSRGVQDTHRNALSASGVSAETTMILGGQIRGEPPGLYLIYPQGNYIHATSETPFLQIGEVKYGKPMLDRFACQMETLEDAARLALVSLDATMKSNISVGPPFEIGLYKSDAFTLARHATLRPDTDYFRAYRASWEASLSQAFRALPRFDGEA